MEDSDRSLTAVRGSEKLTEPVLAVYADGGLIRSNPSPFGATWATCHVDREQRRVWQASGLILPARWNGGKLENNQSEFFALLQGIEALPDGWNGWCFSDNQNTIRRFQNPSSSMNGIPKGWVDSLRQQRRRLGHLRFVLLSGHPSKKMLREQESLDRQYGWEWALQHGAGRSQRPVSQHNVWCDQECGRLSADWLQEQERLKKLQGPLDANLVAIVNALGSGQPLSQATSSLGAVARLERTSVLPGRKVSQVDLDVLLERGLVVPTHESDGRQFYGLA